jgi:hypothetical protein
MGNNFSLKRRAKRVVSPVIKKFWVRRKQAGGNISEEAVETATILNDLRGYDVLVNHFLPLLYGDPKTLANLFCVNKYLKEVGDDIDHLQSEGGIICSVRFYANTYSRRLLYLWLCFVEKCYYECTENYPYDSAEARKLTHVPKYETFKNIEGMRPVVNRIYRAYAFGNSPLFHDLSSGLSYAIIPLHGSPNHWGKLWIITENLFINYEKLSHAIGPVTGYQGGIEYIKSKWFKKDLLRIIRKKFYVEAVSNIAHKILVDTSNKETIWLPDYHTMYWYLRLENIHTNDFFPGAAIKGYYATLLIDADSFVSAFGGKKKRGGKSYIPSLARTELYFTFVKF